MKKLICTGIIAFALIAPSRSHAIETDKAAHLGVSYMITMGTFGIYKAILNRDCRNDRNAPENCPLTPGERLGAAAFAAATSIMIGAIKEMGDRQFDFGDLGADAAGSVIGLSNIVLFQF